MIIDSPIISGSLILTGSAAFTGSLTLSGSMNTIGTITATTLVVQTITSSISQITGSTKFGQLASNTHQFTGSLYVTGALYVASGSINIGTLSPTSGVSLNILAIPNSAGVLLTNLSSTGYTGYRIYNDQASSNRALEIDYAGSSYPGALITSGIVGESAAITTTGAYPLQFGTSNTFRMCILSGGNVGIGTTSPSYNLDVAGTIRSYGTSTITNILIENTNASGYALYQSKVNGSAYTWQFGAWTDGSYRIGQSGVGDFMTITTGGNVYVAQTTGTAAGVSAAGSLQVGKEIISCGTLAGFFWENRSGGVTSSTNWYGWYTTSGTIYLYNGSANIASINTSSGAYTALSDINKKKDIELYTNSGLNAILGLKPTLYRMKNEDETTDKHLGFIAQEVKDYIPEAYVETIAEEKDGGVHIGLNYQAITTTLVKAIQELKAEFDTYKSTHP